MYWKSDRANPPDGRVSERVRHQRWLKVAALVISVDAVSNTVEISRRPRAIAMGITLVLHLAMLAALIAVGSKPIVRDESSPVMVTLPLAVMEDEAGAAPGPDPPPPSTDEGTPPPPPVATQVPVEMPVEAAPLSPPAETDPGSMTPVFDAEPDPATTGDVAGMASAGAGPDAAGTGCPLVASLREALERDARAQAALSLIPRASRSVANAVMLWDGQWIAPTRVGGRATTDTVRASLARIMANASETCRTQVNLGPVFVPVTNDRGTIVLAFGSGAWRWVDVLQGPVQTKRP